MNGCRAEHSHLLALALVDLVDLSLDNHAKALHEEHATQYGHEQLLVNNHGTHTNYTSNGERAGVAHEHLCRIGVVPQETDECTNESAHKHHQFLTIGDIHYIKIGSILKIGAHIGEYTQCHAHDSRVAGTHAVHAVVEVGTIAHCSDHKNRHDHKQCPSCSTSPVAHPLGERAIVKVVVLDKGDGGL